VLRGIITGSENVSTHFSKPRSRSLPLEARKEAVMEGLRMIGVALMSAFGGYIAGVPFGMDERSS
jgi:hypothetical protein